jgi:hypothetical protein
MGNASPSKQLCDALEHGNIALVEKILNDPASGDINPHAKVSSTDLRTPYQCAIFNQKISVAALKLFRSIGKQLNFWFEDGSIVFTASATADHDLLRYLFEEIKVFDANDPNIRNNVVNKSLAGFTPLHQVGMLANPLKQRTTRSQQQNNIDPAIEARVCQTFRYLVFLGANMDAVASHAENNETATDWFLKKNKFVGRDAAMETVANARVIREQQREKYGEAAQAFS